MDWWSAAMLGGVSDSPNQLPSQPQERLLKVVVTLGRDLKVLKVLFTVEGHSGSLDFPFLKTSQQSVPCYQSVSGNLFESTRGWIACIMKRIWSTDLDVHFVSTQNDGNVFTDPLQVSVPVGNVLVGDTRSDVEHDDTALTCG